MKNDKWTFVYSEGHSVLMNEAFFIAFTELKKIPGTFNSILYVNHNSLQNCYVPFGELLRVRDEGVKFFSKDFRSKFVSNLHKCIKDFSIFWEYFNKQEMRKLDNNELLKLFNQYLERLIPMLAYYQVSGGRVYPLLEEKVRNGITKFYHPDEVEQVYKTILAYSEFDILEKEELDLIKLAGKKKITNKNLYEHAQTYSSKYINVYDENKFFRYLEEKINLLKKKRTKVDSYLNELLKKKDKIKINQEKITKKMKNNQLVLNLAKYLRDQGRLRLEYKEWFMGAELKFLNLFKEIAARVGLNIDEYMFSYRIDDTKRFLERGIKLSPKEINTRLNFYIFYQNRGKKYFYTGKEAIELEEKLLKTNKNISELKGIIANRGKVIGKVRIILAKDFNQMKQEMSEFKSGEVLVTTMTQPILVPIMRKAAAIITDQGGITSHAAVIAREFNIPCIIGTYTATKIFNNGDLVEVDANKGIVLRLTQDK